MRKIARSAFRSRWWIIMKCVEIISKNAAELAQNGGPYINVNVYCPQPQQMAVLLRGQQEIRGASHSASLAGGG
jgi:hypothetical protein